MAATNIIEKKNEEELVVSGMPEKLTVMLHHADAFIALSEIIRSIQNYEEVIWQNKHRFQV
ncbi:hypothetical protein Ddye_021731 [Dipteronia dyeriana]|uniref:Uncharacterized protein n=1 Tax=Dipteronia dyeriana TaxID=168575 RepID=A0AAD9U305_9ROSI|nr:hypothetical protein Ddye_021731 [Dipteronia dyeriana]